MRSRRFHEIAFTPAVRAMQEEMGSAGYYPLPVRSASPLEGEVGGGLAPTGGGSSAERAAKTLHGLETELPGAAEPPTRRFAPTSPSRGEALDERLTGREAAFIMERDSFYLASVSETGWPYIQHRGGPEGFVRVLDEHTIGWAEFAGNRQYVSTGNTAVDDRVSLFFMDYPGQRRLKLFGHLRTAPAAEHPELAVPGYRAKVERAALVTIEGFDWNCPQHITPRYTAEEWADAARGVTF